MRYASAAAAPARAAMRGRASPPPPPGPVPPPPPPRPPPGAPPGANGGGGPPTVHAQAPPRLPHATPYYPHYPPVHPASEPPCSIAGILPHSSPAGRLLISGRSGSSSSGGAAGTIIIFIISSRRWRVQRVLVLGCSQPRRLHPKRYRLATARGGALPWLWGSDQGPFFPVFFLWATNS